MSRESECSEMGDVAVQRPVTCDAEMLILIRALCLESCARVTIELTFFESFSKSRIETSRMNNFASVNNISVQHLAQNNATVETLDGTCQC